MLWMGAQWGPGEPSGVLGTCVSPHLRGVAPQTIQLLQCISPLQSVTGRKKYEAAK